MKMRPALGCLALLLALGTAWGEPPTAVEEKAPEFSRKLSRFVYIEDGLDLFFTVGVRAAAFHENDAFFPLEISVTNRQKGTRWVVTRESFVLIDDAGRTYELPSYREFSKGYVKRTFDSRLFDARSVTASKHEGYIQVESNFFPDPQKGISRRSDTVPGPAGVAPDSTSLVHLERLEIPYRHFFEDVLYFPHPQGRLIGPRFSLEFRPKGLEEPARIAFRILDVVPRHGEKAGSRSPQPKRNRP
ncbi:MAG: hypothetical protein ACE5ID_12795 [Acidobacteriota bacterium]